MGRVDRPGVVGASYLQRPIDELQRVRIHAPSGRPSADASHAANSSALIFTVTERRRARAPSDGRPSAGRLGASAVLPGCLPGMLRGIPEIRECYLYLLDSIAP